MLANPGTMVAPARLVESGCGSTADIHSKKTDHTEPEDHVTVLLQQ